MTDKNPALSIVMPVYNRQEYVGDAVKSILNQTFEDFELIIVNDGSADASFEVISSFQDKRIRLLSNDQNMGIVYSRNRGLREARGRYIGMFDSDDIALPEKFEKQVSFLDNNPDFGMTGSWVKWIDENGQLTGEKWKLPASSKKIPAIMLFRNYFVQSTVVIRREAIPEGGYSKGFDMAQDSKMWFDVALKHKTINLPEYLLYYRVHQGNITNHEKHIYYSKKVFIHIFNTLGIPFSDKELMLHLLIKNNEKISDFKKLKEIEQWLLKIKKLNDENHFFEARILKRVIFNRWLKVCYKSKHIPLKMLYKLIFSPLTYYCL